MFNQLYRQARSVTVKVEHYRRAQAARDRGHEYLKLSLHNVFSFPPRPPADLYELLSHNSCSTKQILIFMFLFIDQNKSERISHLFIQIQSKQQQSVLHFIYSSRGRTQIKVELDSVLHFPHNNTSVFVTITVQKKLFSMKVSIMLKTTIKSKKTYFHVNVAQWLILGFHINCLKTKSYF